MGLMEKDPRDMGYVALYIAIKWYTEITSDSAIRIAQGKSHMVPAKKLTPEILAEIKKIMDSPNFYNIDSIVKKFRVNKYELLHALAIEKKKGKIADEEVFIVPKIESDLKRLSDRAKSCPAVNCETCVLNNIAYGEYTLCEILSDMEFDTQGKLVSHENKALQKTAKNCNTELLNGNTKTRGFEIYTNVLSEFDKFAGGHKDKKIRDIASRALLEYVSNNSQT